MDDDGATKDSEARSSSAADSKDGNLDLDRPGSSGKIFFSIESK